MDKCKEYHDRYKNELEMRTEAYCSYGRGFQIFYEDEEMTKTIVQFNLNEISKSCALGVWLLNFQVEVVRLIKNKYMLVG